MPDVIFTSDVTEQAEISSTIKTTKLNRITTSSAFKKQTQTWMQLNSIPDWECYTSKVGLVKRQIHCVNCLWCLGYPDQALERSQEALALARGHNHAFSLVDVLCYAGCLFNVLRRDAPALKNHAEQMLELSKEKSFQGWLGTATMFWGDSLSMLGKVKEGIALIRQGMAKNLSLGTRCSMSSYYTFLAVGEAKAGQLEQALTTLDEGLAMIKETDECYYEAETYRLRGELLLKQGDDAAAEASLYKAIEVARRQKAKSWELRAATDLARVWASQGKAEEAHTLLAPVYDWFTEGFDTPDLIAALALLKELSQDHSVQR